MASNSVTDPMPSETPAALPSLTTSPPPPPSTTPTAASPPPHLQHPQHPQHSQPLSPLLRLPPELRTLIYAHLTPPTTLSYPLGPNTAISALSHRPPPVALLLAHRALAAEALDHFYRVAHFRVMLNPPAPLADPHFQRLAGLAQLRRVRNLDVLLDWDFPRLPGYHGSGVVGAVGGGATGGGGGGGGPAFGGFEFGLDTDMPFFRTVMDRGRCADMLRLAKRLVGVLVGGQGKAAAEELRVCVVSWTDLVEGCWEEKRAVLDTLAAGLTQRGVKMVKGDVVAQEEECVGRMFREWEEWVTGGCRRVADAPVS